MDRSHDTYSSLDELRQIQFESRRSTSVEDLRHYFDRVQSLRRVHVDDFDLQVFIADVQEEIIERARQLREDAAGVVETNEPPPEHYLVRERKDRSPGDAAEIHPDVPRLDTKTWQRATYLALFFTLLICAAFFYLIQTARKINLTPAEVAGQQNQPAANAKGALQQTTAANPAPAPPVNPTLRLYTDLIPGTVSLDGGNPQDLKDGEFVLDNLQPGRHSIKVTGRNGNAEFSFDVAEKLAPKVVGTPSASNVLAVLVSAQNGKGKLITSAEHSQVSLDGKPAGEAGADGLSLDDLGEADHELQITRDKDRQRFVLTYTSAPALTVYVKSDPNAGTMVVMTGQDGADVYVNDKLYRRKTERGQLRIPLKVGEYTIRVHKAGFIDPPPEDVEIKKGEETMAQFRMQPVPETTSLQIKGALPGTMVYIDDAFSASIGADGNATISNVKPGDRVVELRRDQALPKRFQHTFHTGDVVTLSGPDVTLEKVVTENKPAPPPPAPAPSESATSAYSMEVEGQQIRKGGGFVPYHVPKTAGHYSFQAQGRVGGFFKRGKLQWYAGFHDAQNYVLFLIDGKHASVREVRDGKSTEINRIPFNVDSGEWVQVDLSVKPNSIDARVKTPGGAWSDLGSVSSPGRDFTQDKVGFYIPGNDEVSISNFRFSDRK